MQQHRIVCLVAAAGRGIRFGREMPKSFYPVGGRSLLVWSIEGLRAGAAIDRFIVMVPQGWEQTAREQLDREIPDLSAAVIAGGETRQESVEIGLSEAGGAGIVLVHDAARPCFTAALVGRVVEATLQAGAAVPALQATDTLGRIRDEDLEAIVPRERVVGIQTPQGFRAAVLRKAFEQARDSGLRATDESSLVLAAGMPVKVVEGERRNIKVTVKDDLEIVAGFLGVAPAPPQSGE
ncbi:MAG: 2-C-methyl-D-erythritol 4-phosphate cytidylyltransferase [Candidatus Krumholzibacteria bacterium]|nr:2-C-methyl-D-erythritol 4-phosphate cytidylyltransferase [Candidatus Krumholzibacteria bacterium]